VGYRIYSFIHFDWLQNDAKSPTTRKASQATSPETRTQPRRIQNHGSPGTGQSHNLVPNAHHSQSEACRELQAFARSMDGVVVPRTLLGLPTTGLISKATPMRLNHL